MHDPQTGLDGTPDRTEQVFGGILCLFNSFRATPDRHGMEWRIALVHSNIKARRVGVTVEISSGALEIAMPLDASRETTFGKSS